MIHLLKCLTWDGICRVFKFFPLQDEYMTNPPKFYFVHSYKYVHDEEKYVIGITDYGGIVSKR